MKISANLWQMLAIGGLLSIVGFAAAWQHKVRVDSLAHHEQNRTLRVLARAAARVIDGDQHDQFLKLEDMESDKFVSELSKLDAIRHAHPDIAFVYTLRLRGSAWEFVLDPTPAGDHDNDGIEDRSKLLDPYNDISDAAKEAYRTGTVTTDPEPISDSWGTFYSAYAPILSSDGAVVGIAGVDIRDTVLRNKLESNWHEFWRLCGLATVVCALLSLIIGFFRPVPSPNREELDTAEGNLVPTSVHRLLLLGALGLTLVCVGAALFVGLGGSSDPGLSRSGHDEMRHWIYAARRAKDLSQSDIESLEDRCLELGLGSLISNTTPNSTSPLNALDALELRIRQDEARIAGRQQETSARLYQKSQTLTWTSVVAALLASCCTIALWRVNRQREWVKSAQIHLRRSRRNLNHLKQNMPVGCFQVAEGKFEKPNMTALRMLGLKGPLEFDREFRSCIHPDDVEILNWEADFFKNERTTHVRVLDASGQAKYFEIRTSPVFQTDGSLKFSLCFLIDVDKLVQNNLRLKEQQAYIESTNRQLRITFDELVSNFDQTVAAFIKAVEAKDPYTAGHSERVAHYSVAIAQALGLPHEEVRTIELGCLLHDVGKLGIPDELLTQVGELSAVEVAKIREHPELGAYLMADVPRCRACLPIIRSHHERLDGSGYPDGLQGDAIGLHVRICSVADSFDAMVSARAYRNSKTVEEALCELQHEAQNNRLDGKIVQTFADMIRDGSILVAEIAKHAA